MYVCVCVYGNNMILTDKTGQNKTPTTVCMLALQTGTGELIGWNSEKLSVLTNKSHLWSVGYMFVGISLGPV